MTINDTPVITIDIRSNRPHSGKTLMARVMWDALRKVGFDPNGTHVSVDSQDRDLDATMFEHQEDLDSVVAEAIEKLNRAGTRVLFIDRNLPPQLRPATPSVQSYQIRSRTQNGQWSFWKACSLDTYLQRMQEPVDGNTMFEVRSVYFRPDGPTVEVPENTLAAFREMSMDLLKIAEQMDYDTSYAGEEAGSLKRLIRAQSHALRALMNALYDNDPSGTWNKQDVQAVIDKALEDGNK